MLGAIAKAMDRYIAPAISAFPTSLWVMTTSSIRSDTTYSKKEIFLS